MVLLHLSDDDRSHLEGLLRKSTAEQRLVRRAAIVLELAGGASLIGTARKLGIDREQVALWRDRFLEGGVSSLEKDRPRPGKPKTIAKATEEAVLTLTRMTTPDGGTHWSTRTMAEVSGRFFAQITTRRIRRGSFESVKELQDEIKHYLKVHNQDPKPFKWTASAEAIIEKIARCRTISQTLYQRDGVVRALLTELEGVATRVESERSLQSISIDRETNSSSGQPKNTRV